MAALLRPSRMGFTVNGLDFGAWACRGGRQSEQAPARDMHHPRQEVGMFVNAREGESFEDLYRRFKRGVEASGILREYRRKQRFKPAHEERRDKIRAAARKLRRARGRRSD